MLPFGWIALAHRVLIGKRYRKSAGRGRPTQNATFGVKIARTLGPPDLFTFYFKMSRFGWAGLAGQILIGKRYGKSAGRGRPAQSATFRI